MATAKLVFRPTVTADMIIGTVEVLQHYRSIYGLNAGALELLVKFEKDLIGIGYGTKTPAYVATGIRKEGTVNMDALGATPKEKEFAHMTEDEQFAELERLNQEMLAGLVASGEAGSENVILEERRDSERLASEAKRNEQSTDSDTMHNALMSML